MLQPFESKLLDEIVVFLGECWRDDPARNFHPGDFLHWMTNYCRGEGLGERFFCARDRADLVAFVEINTKHSSIAAVIDTHLRGTHWESDLLLACREALFVRGCSEFNINLSENDTKSRMTLEMMGFSSAKADYGVLLRELNDIPFPVLPSGFHIRTSTRDDAAQLATLHGAAFGKPWREDEYREVMHATGFVVENEIVVFDPNEKLVAFAVLWPDPISKSGLFEPVGCHPDFTRMGLTKALMHYGLSLMQQAGMTKAYVGHEPSNAASSALYRSVGFAPGFSTIDFKLKF